MRRLLPGLLLLAVLTGCSADDPSSAPTPVTGSPTAPLPSATPVPAPPKAACYRLDYDAAVAPTHDGKPVDCQDAHTSMTIAVGPLDAVVDGHLLAVDSRHVQEQVAATCTNRFADFVGGSPEDQRLSMLRTVWFTPTVEQSDAGASWHRCDVIAVAADERLAPLTGPLDGVLDDPEGRDRYGMCGTAEPGTEEFARVICSSAHSWRAIATVPFPDGPYPGEDQVRAAGEEPCQDAARSVAADTLDFQWGYEWPVRDQWDAGQHYGLCWAPD